MCKLLHSYAIVPHNLYVERDADKQIAMVVNRLSKPGYVMCARQMGKTNLLMHTKDIFENDRNVFSYIDLTSVLCNTESECYDEIIDIIIDSHQDIFREEYEQIESRRSTRGDTTQREFTRDLRLLLKKVDKLVIILDEIEALLNQPFSDNIFSLIRSHYFQRTNYPDMSKLGYLLAGVTEPQKIIKSKAISPFNVYQRIYVKDFTYEEYQVFLNNAEMTKYFDKDVLDRIYYWTSGQPRMTWDICQYLTIIDNNSIDSIDDIVNKCYLQDSSKPPVDSIREMVSIDLDLKDAVAQIVNSNSLSLAPEMKSRLFLAGIIKSEYEPSEFKNPIIAKSLSAEWLESIGGLSQETTRLIESAKRLILIDGDYRRGVELLNAVNKENTIAECLDEINWLMGEALMRQLKAKDAVSYLKKVSRGSQRYLRSQYLTTKALVSLCLFKEAIQLIDNLLPDEILDNEYKNKLLIVKVESLIESKGDDNWNLADKTLSEIQARNDFSDRDIHLEVTILYYAARLSRKKRDKEIAISYLDSALQYAQLNERPVLLYEKYRCAENANQARDFMVRLISEVSSYKGIPSIDRFDNEMVFSQYYAMLIFAEVIVNYPDLENSISNKYKWFYEKKEDLYCTICSTLDANNNPLAKHLAHKIVVLKYDHDWKFLPFQLLEAFSIWTKRASSSKEMEDIGWLLQILLRNGFNGNVPEILIKPLVKHLYSKVNNKNYSYINETLILISKHFRKINAQNPKIYEYILLCLFFKTIIYYENNDYVKFWESVKKCVLGIEKFMDGLSGEENLDFPISTLYETIDTIRNMGAILTGRRIRLLHLENNNKQYGNNTKIVVYDNIHDREIIGKYKNLKRDIECGFMEVKKVLQ